MDFDSIKNLSAWEILKMIRQAQKQNTEILKQNSVKIETLLEQNYSKPTQDQVRVYQQKNNEILKQNNEYIKLHNSLLTYLKSLKGDALVSKPESQKIVKSQKVEPVVVAYDFDEYFDKTINGLLDYNSNHPFYNSKDFKDKLLEHYIDSEQYEKCSSLVDNLSST